MTTTPRVRYLIVDVEHRQVREAFADAVTLDLIYGVVGGHFCLGALWPPIAPRGIGHVLYVHDRGLLEPEIYGRGYFAAAYQRQALAGNAIILGVLGDEEVGATIPLDEVRQRIAFLGRLGKLL